MVLSARLEARSGRLLGLSVGAWQRQQDQESGLHPLRLLLLGQLEPLVALRPDLPEDEPRLCLHLMDLEARLQRRDRVPLLRLLRLGLREAEDRLLPLPGQRVLRWHGCPPWH